MASYAWDFGDGATGTGKTATHTYASASTYQVKLTVTDDKGATGTATNPVTVTAAAAALASDAFTRTVTGGWGSADAGGVWTTSGASSNFAVTGGVGTMKMPTAGYGPSAMLNSVSSSATDLTITMSSDKVATGNGIYISAIGRHTAGGDYRGKARVQANGAVAVSVSSVVGGTETLLGGKEVVVSGLTYSVGTKLRMRLQVQGTTTTTIRVKVWDASTAEPTAWLISQTDSTAALQGAGSVGLMTYLSGSATNPPVTVSFDDLSVQPM